MTMKRIAKRKRGDTIVVANLLTQTPPKMPSFCGCLPQSWVSHLWGLFLELRMKRQIFKHGETFGNWTVLEQLTHKGHCVSRCRCKCGTERIIRNECLRSGRRKSCGCSMRTQDGKSKSKEYNSWKNMLTRCTNPASDNYPLYGGRGIRVCDRWLVFSNFLDDMGYIPSKGMSIDRIDSDGHYEKTNCRWATACEQSNNRRNNHLITAYGETLTLMQWAKKSKINKSTIFRRLKRGLTEEEAVCGK